MKKTVVVTNETKSGRNINFKDTKTSDNMTLKQFVNKIENGNYEGAYHLRVVNGKKTPCSNPDKSESNNLD